MALLIFVGLALSGSYAYYVNRNIDSLVARDLRGLATLTSQIESVIATHRETLRDYARDATEPALVIPTGASPREYRDFELLRRDAPATLDVSGNEILDPREVVRQSVDVTGSKARLDLHYTAITRVLDGQQQLVRNDATGTMDLKRVVRPLFNQDFLSVFDLVLLAAPDGKIVYVNPTTQPSPLPVPFAERSGAGGDPRAGSAGIVVTNLGAISKRKGWNEWGELEVETLRGVSRQTLVRIMDRDYYLFTQPLRFVSEQCINCVAAQAQTKEEVTELLVCALVPKAVFRSRALAVPAPVFTLLAGTLLLLACCWPYIRIVKLREHAPLKPSDVILAALAALVGGAILALAISDIRIFRRLGGMEDRQLAEYARKLRSDFMNDLLRVSYLAENLRDAGLPQDPKEKRDRFMTGVDGDALWKRGPVWRYPYFRRAMWIHPDGTAVVLDAAEKAPPPIDVRDRAFFRDLRANRWSTVIEYPKPDSKQPAPSRRSHRFIAEIIRTPDAHVTILAVPPREGIGVQPPSRPVFAVVAPFIHFVDPVVPPGFRFAVIDQRGTVLFHSERERSLNENFFRETDDDRHLRSAFFARRDQQVNGRYWGVDHQMFVAPIPGSPWVVVAMRDESLLRSVNTEIVALTTLLLTLYAALYALGFAILAVVHPKYRAPWLWPHQSMHDGYAATICALLIEILALVCCIGVLTPGALLLVGFVAPIRGITTAYIIMNGERGLREQLIRDGHDTVWFVGVVVSIALTGLWCYAIGHGRMEPDMPWFVETAYKTFLMLLVLAGFVLSVPLRNWLTEVAAALAHWFRKRLEATADAWRAVVYRRDFGTRVRRAPRWLQAYELTGFLLLFVSAVLPALTFLKVAGRLGIEARVKFSQLALTDMLERRLNLLEASSLREPRIAHDCYSIRHIFNSAWTLDPRAVTSRPNEFATTPPRRTESDRRVPVGCRAASGKPSWFPMLLQALLPRYAESSVSMRELHHDEASDETWHWCREGQLLTLRKHITLQPETTYRMYAGAQPRQELVVQSIVPRIAPRFDEPAIPDQNCHSEPYAEEQLTSGYDALGIDSGRDILNRTRIWRRLRLLLYLTAIGIAAYVLFSAIGFLARRVFLIGVSEPAWLARDKPLRPGIGTHLFVQHAASVGTLAELSRFPTVTLQDVRNKTTTWSDVALTIDQTRTADILISDFEVGLDDTDFSTQKLRLFERLIEARRHTLVVFSTLTAAGVLARASGALRERWSRVFDAFMRIDESLLLKKIRGAATHDHDTEPCGRFHNSEGIPERVLQRSWDDCSTDEKLALYHLASHGLASHRHAHAVGRLLGRHFVCRAPALRVCCRAFHDFVVRAGDAENLTGLALTGGVSAWDRLRIPLAFLAIATISLIVTTQQDLITSTSAIITGLAAGLPALIKLVGLLTGKTATDEE